MNLAETFSHRFFSPLAQTSQYNYRADDVGLIVNSVGLSIIRWCVIIRQHDDFDDANDEDEDTANDDVTSVLQQFQ